MKDVYIICPDQLLNPDTEEMVECGKQILTKDGKCPRCGGKTWFPAASQGGIVQRIATTERITRLEKALEETYA